MPPAASYPHDPLAKYPKANLPAQRGRETDLMNRRTCDIPARDVQMPDRVPNERV
jgi:hypothetical protein